MGDVDSSSHERFACPHFKWATLSFDERPVFSSPERSVMHRMTLGSQTAVKDSRLTLQMVLSVEVYRPRGRSDIERDDEEE